MSYGKRFDTEPPDKSGWYLVVSTNTGDWTPGKYESSNRVWTGKDGQIMRNVLWWGPLPDGEEPRD